MKNPNGFGTVYKLSGKWRHLWVAVVSTGNRKKVSGGRFETTEKVAVTVKTPIRHCERSEAIQA